MQSRSSHATVSGGADLRSSAAARRAASASTGAAASSPIGISNAVAEFDAAASTGTATPGGAAARAVEGIEPGSGRSSDGMSQQLEFLMSSMRSKIQNAVSEMQAQLQEELQEEDLKIHHVLGQGAFGTVYHGPYQLLPSLSCFLRPLPPVALIAAQRDAPFGDGAAGSLRVIHRDAATRGNTRTACMPPDRSIHAATATPAGTPCPDDNCRGQTLCGRQG